MKAAVVVPAVLAAGISCAPLAHAAGGTQASAEQAVQQIYSQVQQGCTPRTPPQFQRIVWDSFTGDHGTGRIIDATPGLGGPFQAWWNLGPTTSLAGARVAPAQPQGYWDVVLEFC